MIDLNDIALPHHPVSQIFPMMAGADFDSLVENVRAQGLIEPIWVDENGSILDGRNRERACLLTGVPIQARTYDGTDPLGFVVGLNLHRRHLNESQRAMIAARLANIELGDNQFRREGPPMGGPSVSTVQAAAILNVGSKTVERARTVRDKGAPAIQAAIDAGKLAVRDAASVTDLPAEEQESLLADVRAGKHKTLRRAAVARRREVRETPPANLPAPDARCRLLVSAVADIANQVEPGSIDCIICDPPYPREFLPVYADLARAATRVLKPGGSCLVMVGQSYLPQILEAMTPHLRYHWTLAYLTPGGQSVQLWERKVNTFWKPVLWFVNGGEGYAGDWVGDVARSAPNDNDKRFHHWGQSESGMADLVRRFSSAGETVLDPFLGGGTTGVVALDLGRRFVGADLDADAVATARARLVPGREASDAGQA